MHYNNTHLQANKVVLVSYSLSPYILFIFLYVICVSLPFIPPLEVEHNDFNNFVLFFIVSDMSSNTCETNLLSLKFSEDGEKM